MFLLGSSPFYAIYGGYTIRDGFACNTSWFPDGIIHTRCVVFLPISTLTPIEAPNGKICECYPWFFPIATCLA